MAAKLNIIKYYVKLQKYYARIVKKNYTIYP